MNDFPPKYKESLRAIIVDMSSEAIARRLREVSELNQLGMSLAKAKPILSPIESGQVEAVQRSDQQKPK